MNPMIPRLTAFRVVSFPATSRRVKKRSRSRSVSSVTVPSSRVTVAVVRTVQRSSAGSARLRSVSSWAYIAISIMAASYVAPWSSPVPSSWYSGSLPPIVRLLHSRSLWRSSSGTPMMSAMAMSGSSAATSTTKSADPLSQIRSRMMVVRSSMTSSIRLIMRGVKPVLTSLR